MKNPFTIAVNEQGDSSLAYFKHDSASKIYFCGIHKTYSSLMCSGPVVKKRNSGAVGDIMVWCTVTSMTVWQEETTEQWKWSQIVYACNKYYNSIAISYIKWETYIKCCKYQTHFHIVRPYTSIEYDVLNTLNTYVITQARWWPSNH